MRQDIRMAALLAVVTLSPLSAAEATCLVPPADFNGSGGTDVTDIQCQIASLIADFEGEALPPCLAGTSSDLDIDCNGAGETLDVQLAIVATLGSPWPEEIDADGDYCAEACLDTTPSCAPGDPCGDPANVGDPACLLYEIDHPAIGSNGFGALWRGQDLAFGAGVQLTGIAFKSNQAGPTFDEFRLMTSVDGLETLATTTTISKSSEAPFSTWDTGAFAGPRYLEPNATYTVWFHLIAPTATSGCELIVEDPTWGGHHTSSDPNGLSPGSYPQWYYEYGTNFRAYGCFTI